MNQDVVVDLATNALTLAFKVAMPMLAAGLIVGLVVSIFQAVTQIQEQTLAFIPKVIALAAVLMLLGPWMLNQLLAYTADLWGGIPNIVG
jgi:flagellar biosynthetic protein FliQ